MTGDGARVIAVPVLFIENNKRILFIYLYFFSPTLKRVLYNVGTRFSPAKQLITEQYAVAIRLAIKTDRNCIITAHNTLRGIVVSPVIQ